MTEDEAKEYARLYAKVYGSGHSYYKEPFEPHKWVVEAIIAAFHSGLYRASNPRMDSASKPVSNTSGVDW